MKEHHFKVEDAIKYGVECAVILYNLRFWLEKNKANGTNIHEGRVWTYNSVKAWSELFPYLTQDQIRYKLGILEKAGVIKKGNFNKAPYDRTAWYTIWENSQMDLVKSPNAFGEIPKPIPDSKPDSKHSSETDVSQEENYEAVDDEGNPFVVKQKADTTYKKLYQLWWDKYPVNWNRNRTQISSAKNLLEEHGMEQVEKALTFWRKYKSDPFCPDISTPYDLDSKWDKLLQYKKRIS
jgi:hypothetical protein